MTAESPPEFEAFLSYCHEDQERVQSVHAALEKANIRVWRDAGQIVGGDAWIKNIEAGLSQSNCVVLFNSRSALRSVWVQREWNVALALNKRIVPVRLDDADVPLLLKATEFVEFHDASQLDKAVEGIVRGIRGARASIRESGMESGPQTLSNPSVIGPDITVLNRMIQSESNNERNLALARWCAAGIGLLAVIGLMIWAGATRNGWTALLALTPLAISGAISWVITSQLRSSRSTALRLATIKDGIELYCPKQGPCAQFRTELEKILKQRAGIQEVGR
jgi:hypothetical protein